MQHIYNVEIGKTAVTGIQPPHTMLNEGIQGRVGLLRARDVNGELSRKQGYRQLKGNERNGKATAAERNLCKRCVAR